MPREKEKTIDEKELAKARLLKQMRKDAGLSQKDLAEKLGIRREKVNAIENANAQSIGAITTKLQEEWWAICKPKAKQSTLEMFKAFILSVYRF